MSHDPHDAAVAAHAPKTPEPKRARVAKTVAFVALSLAALVFFTQAFDDAEVTVGSPRPDTVIDEPAGEEAAPDSQYVTPTAASFDIALVTTERQTFGSAGDLVTWQLQAAYLDDGELDPDVTYLVTFDVTGGEDGVETFTFEVNGGEFEVIEHMSSVPPGGEVSARITSVREG